MRTVVHDGCIVDLGPDAIGTTAEVCGALGVDTITPAAASGTVHVAHDGRLDALPRGLVFGVPRDLGSLGTTPLLPFGAKLRAACDLVLPARAHDGSLGKLVERRLGRLVKERLVEPLVAGVYGGDVDRLDAGVVMPHLASASGSLIRAMARTPRSTGAPFRAPRGGMRALIETMAVSLGRARIRASSRVATLSCEAGGVRLHLVEGSGLAARHVVLATPPASSRALLADVCPSADEALSIRMRSTVVVALAFESNEADLPTGSGVLVARGEKACFVAATFVHAKWPSRVRKGRALVRAVVDLDRAPDLRDADDTTIAAAVLADLRRWATLGNPRWAIVHRFPASTPIPEVGHRSRVTTARELVAKAGPISLVGAAYDGPGLAGCLRGAEAFARNFV